MTKRIKMMFLIMVLLGGSLHAQIAKNSALFLALQQEDSIFFERGFNRCDLDYLEKKVTDNLKFYHDNGGFQDKKLFLERTKQNICGNMNQKMIRKVVANSLEVFPLYDNGQLYGAIQSGTHLFYIREPNKADVCVGQAKFTTVWTMKNGNWMMDDILSYDHKEPESSFTEKTRLYDDKSIENWLQENNIPILG